MHERFVNILRDRAPSVLPAGAPELGFTCGVGWFPILYDLVTAIQLHNQAVGVPEDNVVAVQIKEKFGGLRFYVGRAPESVHRMIGLAENMSMRTCEECGDAGARVEVGSWVRTLCQPCHKVAVWRRAEKMSTT